MFTGKCPGVGKTTLALALRGVLGEKRVLVFNQDLLASSLPDPLVRAICFRNELHDRLVQTRAALPEILVIDKNCLTPTVRENTLSMRRREMEYTAYVEFSSPKGDKVLFTTAYNRIRGRLYQSLTLPRDKEMTVINQMIKNYEAPTKEEMDRSLGKIVIDVHLGVADALRCLLTSMCNFNIIDDMPDDAAINKAAAAALAENKF